jgi:hypothetical protein
LDLLDLAILALRIALVAVLYAFLLLVVRFAARSLWMPARQPARGSERAAGPARLRMVVVAQGGSDLAPGDVLDVAEGAVLGRGARAQVIISDAAVSAEHARLNRSGRTWLVADLGSTNGTRVNDLLVNGEARIAEGDVVALGNVRLKVVGADASY